MTSIVSRLRFDVERFQYFLFDRFDLPLEMLLFDGTPRRETWQPQPIYVERPRLEPPDIWHLAGAAILVMDDDVVKRIEPFVSMAGELLPVYVAGTGEPYHALNILADIDCLRPGSYSLDYLEFYPDFLEHRLPETGLFKISQLDTAETFHVERADDRESFRLRVEENGLRGLEFEPVWSSETGPPSLNLFDA